MGIQSFLKAKKGDPDWTFTPEQYFDKEFKVIDANLIELRQGKSDSIILRQSPSEKEMLAKHLRIDVREGSTLDLAIINEAADKMQQVFIYDIRVREGGHINMGIFAKGGKLNKHIIQVILDEGANFNSYGHILNSCGGDTEVVSKIEHHGSYSVSNQFYTCEAGKGSQTVFQSMVNVPKEVGYGTVGIESINLIQGPGGMCHCVPEVYNLSDSFKVSSGVDTEILDPERIYYLQTRGLKQSAAEAMLILAHRQQVLSLIQIPEIKEEIEQILIA
jgi:Fe-S cluster assembly scaffold protein SufB